VSRESSSATRCAGWRSSIGVSGWARNTSEGTVEAVFEGEAEAVERLVSFAHTGPSDARVEAVDVHEEEPEDLSGFAIR
jgi:acylphosphatase